MNNKLIVRQLNGANTVEFYASVYNQKSKPIAEHGKKFREVVRPGAFDNADTTNVKATVFHDKNKIIGRTKSNTLELVSDDYGLKAIVTMGTTTLHKDTIEQIERGDLFESSFIARMDKFKEVYEDGELVRYIDSFSIVRDVSIVDDGAYSNTDIIVRELPNKIEIKNSINKSNNQNQMNYIDEIKRALNNTEKTTIEIERAASTDGAITGLNGNVPQGVSRLDIMGKSPVWKKLGVDYLPNCQGTFVLPFDTPLTASELNELAAVTPVDLDMGGNLVSAKRFSVQRKFTYEALANANPENMDALLNDMYKAVDRKLSEKVFSIAEAGATEIATVTAVDEDGFDGLSVAIDTENKVSFLMSRSLFFAKKKTKLDAGSGLHVMKKDGEFAKTWEGDDVFYSTLFPTTDKVIAGDMKRILVADYNKTEVIVDPYTLAGKGQVIITVIGLYGVALRNPNAFTKSAAIAA